MSVQNGTQANNFLMGTAPISLAGYDVPLTKSLLVPQPINQQSVVHVGQVYSGLPMKAMPYQLGNFGVSG